MRSYLSNIRSRTTERMASRTTQGPFRMFYSPILMWWMWWGAVLLIGAIAVFCFVGLDTVPDLWPIGPALMAYLFFCYLYVARFNCSFALTGSELLVLRAHWPFQQTLRFDLKNLQNIRLASHPHGLRTVLSGTEKNYLAFDCGGQTYLFDCFFLQVDSYDENFTDQNLDDLAIALEELGCKVSLEGNLQR